MPTPPTVSVSLGQTPTATATINQPVSLDPFPLENLSDVDSSLGLHDGYMLVYDGATSKWKIQPFVVPTAPTPDTTILVAGNEGTGSIGPGDILTVQGAGGIDASLSGKTLTISPTRIDGGSFG